MGPFKHTVDDGLDVRKAAFECMYTLLDSCLEELDILQFLDHVEEGLKDHYDIRVGRKQPRKARLHLSGSVFTTRVWESGGHPLDMYQNR